MANLITLTRLLLLFVLVALAYRAQPSLQLAAVPLLLLIIGLDGLDGYVARLRGETSTFGSIFDIAVDRAVENVLWIVLGDLGIIPIWVAFVFIVRGAIVDSMRHAMVGSSDSAFGVMQSRLGRLLVAGRFMRGFYGTVKALTFATALLLLPLPAVAPATWKVIAGPLHSATMVLVYASVVLCLLRGLPVVAEFLTTQKVFAPKGTPLLGSR